MTTARPFRAPHRAPRGARSSAAADSRPRGSGMPSTSIQKQASAPQTGVPQTPSAPPPPPALPQASSLPALSQQLTQLQVQLAGLDAQWTGLQNQLESMRIDNPARPPVQAKAADVGVQIAQVRGQIATIQAQINVFERSGFPGARGPRLPRGNGRPSMDPDAVTAIFIVFTLAVLMPLSIGIARRLWRRGSKSDAPAHDPMIAPRLDRLEQAVDAIAIEIERRTVSNSTPRFSPNALRPGLRIAPFQKAPPGKPSSSCANTAPLRS